MIRKVLFAVTAALLVAAPAFAQSNGSVGTVNQAAPGAATQIGVRDGSGKLQPIGSNTPLPVTQGAGTAGGASTTGTQTNVASSASDGSLLASNVGRKGATFFNDSTSVLYLLAAAGTSSATVYTVQVQPGGYYELPTIQGGVYTGVVRGIWASANGSVRVTEWS